MSDTHQKSSLTFTLLFSAFVATFGSSFLYGYNLSVLNLPAHYVKCFFGKTILNNNCTDELNHGANLTTTSGEDDQKSAIDETFLYGMVNSAFVAAGTIGAFSSGWIADFFGRRNGLMFNCLFAIAGGIICGPAVYAQAPAMMYIGRFLIGVNNGVTVGLTSMYLTEIAPRDVRGSIGACHQLAVTSGIVIGYFITLDFALNTEHLWSVAEALTAIPAFISLILLLFCPESPRYLFVKKGNEEDARKAFLRVNQVEDVDHFITELKLELEANKNRTEFRFTKLFTQKDLRMPLAIACIIQVMQQLSGINAVLAYSGTLLETAGVHHSMGQYFVLGFGIWNFLATCVSMPLIERAGRRTLILAPSAFIVVSLLVLTVMVNIQSNPGVDKSVTSMVAVAAGFVFIAAFAIGLGPIPAIIVSEVTRQETRAAAYSVSQGLQWGCCLLVMSSYPSLNEEIGGWVFLIYMSVIVLCFIFFLLFLPETRNRTFDDVAKYLADNNIRRLTVKFTEEYFKDFNGMGDAEKNSSKSSLQEEMPLMENGTQVNETNA